jgi:hypothetical protein
MNRHRCLALKIATAFILLTSTASSADECFNSSKKLNDDAQTIRLKAMDMGWTVGKSASITAASIVKGKSEIYPKDNVEICLREEGVLLQIKVQSQSKDAGIAKWHKVIARKIGNKT